MKVLCVIPARYASTRLPGKPLKLIGKKAYGAVGL
jgi:3-deoxy-manno-octulosonate cytidylyltransferase (CMP-KDO synthetase)